MKMREYVDGLQGPGSWDKMHDRVNDMRLDGWTLPPVTVDGKTVHVFPGTDRDATLEQVQDEVRRALRRGRALSGDLPPTTETTDA